MIVDVGDDSFLSCLLRKQGVNGPLYSVERKPDSEVVWSQVRQCSVTQR